MRLPDHAHRARAASFLAQLAAPTGFEYSRYFSQKNEEEVPGRGSIFLCEISEDLEPSRHLFR